MYSKYTEEHSASCQVVSTFCQWSIFCYNLFNVVKNDLCRKSKCNLCMQILEHPDFSMDTREDNILCNIFFKKICLETPP